MTERPALSRERVIDAAASVADHGGLAAVSMRNVGKELGVEAMSLYHHVANKEAMLDELVDWVFCRIELPEPNQPWRPAMVERASSARDVLFHHPWALGLIESRRTPGEALLHHHDAVLGCLRTNGFPIALAAHAFSVIDAYVYGFVLTELNLPFAPDEDAESFAAGIDLDVETYPHMAEMVQSLAEGAEYSFVDEFHYGLDLILDALDRRRAEPGTNAQPRL